MPQALKSSESVTQKFPSFGPNKRQELDRLVFEICKRERIAPDVFLAELPIGVKRFPEVKQWLIQRRFPELTSAGIPVSESFPAIGISPGNRMDVGVRPALYPKKVYVERGADGSDLARRLRCLFPEARFETIESYRKFFQGKPFTPADYNRRLETFFVVSERYDFFKACPCTNGAKGCGYHNVNLGFGCPFDCSYCFLQHYTNAPGIVFPSNLDSFFEAFAGYRQKIRVGSGETTDSLAFDHITEYSPKLIDFFRGYPQAQFEFKTKSDNVALLLSAKAAPNVVVAWSVNPQSIIDREEFFTASLEQRLNAARACVQAGYSTAFHFDPIILYPGWEKDYQDVVERIFTSVPEESVRWISLGSLRMTPEQKKMIENRFPENTILDAELVTAPDGKLRYHEQVRQVVYRTMLEYIRRYTDRRIVYLCMEPAAMWGDAGITFDGSAS
jgi:spore photoproduct lyase